MQTSRSVLSLIPNQTVEALALLGRADWKELSRARTEPVTEGMSGAFLFRVIEDDTPLRYLKIAQHEAIAPIRREIMRTRWLAENGVRVAPILRVEDRAGQVAMLTQAVPGSPAEASPLPAARLIEVLARGLADLHKLPAANCPFDESLAVRLSRAAEAVASGEVDPAAFAPRNRGTAPEVLLARLAANQPEQDLVVVHGDATLTNLIVDPGGNLGFVDCGSAGRGDRYIDLAVLADQIEDYHGAEAAAHFVRAYGLRSWDSAKALYFSDLYELF
jgi:aminoglycoside 3'-phosphotransferase II